MRDRSFLILLVSSFISEIGDQAALIAFGLAVFAAGGSGSVLAVGLMWVVKALVRLLVQPFAGVLADRLDRKTILVCSSLGMALTCMALVPAVHAAVAVQLTLIGLLQLLNCFYGPASSAIMPSIVEHDGLQRANGLLRTGLNIARVAGPALGGVLYAAVGARWIFGFDGVTFAALAVGLTVIRVNSAPNTGSKPSVLGQLREGAGYVRRSRFLVAIVVMSILDSMVWRAVEIVLVPLSVGPLHVGPGGLGWGYTLLTSGSLVGAIIAARLSSLPGRPEVLLATYSLLGVPLMLVGWWLGATEFFAAMFACGVILDLFGVSVMSAIQAGVAEAMRGRVAALIGTASALGALPVALLVDWLVGVVGYGGILAWGGVLLAISGSCLAFNLRRSPVPVPSEATP